MTYINNPIIVLGMHRSATSLIARSLHKEGVKMGGDKWLAQNKGNNGGHYENAYFVAVNDLILRDAGGSWDNPPSEEAILKAGEKNEAMILEAIALSKADKWGWKDPRTVLTIRCYLPYLKDPFFIFCLRKPDEVAKSLENNYEMKFDDGLKLAKEYNRRLVKFMSEVSLES